MEDLRRVMVHKCGARVGLSGNNFVRVPLDSNKLFSGSHWSDVSSQISGTWAVSSDWLS